MFDFLGKMEEMEEFQEDQAGVYQTSDFSLLDEKTGSLHITDDTGKMTTVVASGTFSCYYLCNGKQIMDQLYHDEQYDAMGDFIDLIMSFDFEGGTQ